MKIMKKVVLYVLAGIFLGPFACLHISNTAECSTGGELDVVVDFGVQRWSDNWAYCTFPELTVAEKLPNSIKTIQISYSGEDTTNAEITLPTMDGFTASADNVSTLVTCTTTEVASSVQEFLRNVQYKCETSQSISILLSESKIPNDVHYFPGTGHFYKYVPYLDISWTDAYKEAMNSEFGGWTGYLANVISKQENDFILKYAGKTPMESVGWLGGTTAILSNINTANVAIANNNIGYWYWSGGPELCATLKPQYSTWTIKGKNRPISKEESNYFDYNYASPNPENSVFYNTSVYNGTTGFQKHMPFDFELWARANDGISLGLNEPNQSPGDQPYLATIKNHSTWNNSPLVPPAWDDVYRTRGYVIEYGDELWENSTPLAGSVIVSTNITKQTTLTAPAQNAVFDPGTTVTASGTGVPGYTVNIVEGSKTLATTKVDSDGYWSVPLSGLPGATHDVLITQTNSYGNIFPAVPLSFKILKIPTSSDFDCILPASLG